MLFQRRLLNYYMEQLLAIKGEVEQERSLRERLIKARLWFDHWYNGK
jgi:hypothetical protein